MTTMRSAAAPIPCLLLSLGLLAPGSGIAHAQPGTLQVPAQRPAEAPAKPPAAAPRQPVQQAGKPPPVVQPHGTPHAQKPLAHPTKQAAKPPTATPKPERAPAAPPVVPDAAAPAKPAQTTKPPATKGPIPRFAALRFDEVNMRRGPGPRYPIEWVYKRRDLPIEIEREFDIWRLIRDPDGIRGWVSEASLTGRRTFIVTGADATLRRDASDTAGAVAILKPGVIGRIRSCEAGAEWCNVQVGDYRGYLKRAQFWGTQPGEAVNP